MRIALFAADQVGLQVARFLGEQTEGPVCLVLDARDHQQLNAQIETAVGIGQERTIATCRQSRSELAGHLSQFEPDLGVLAWWPYLLDRAALQVPRLGCLNFHPSWLPYGRGKSPNFWSLVEKTPFGVTLHWVDEAIDHGEIAFQRKIETGWEDTGGTLYRRALDEIVELFVESYPRILAGHIPRIPQPEEAPCHYHRDLHPASRIELNRGYQGRDLLNLLRARTFPPHPAAWFEEDGRRYEVRISITPVEANEK